MEVGVQPFGAHFRYLFDLSIVDVFEEPTEIGPRVQGLQLLLVQIQLLVDSSLVLQLQQVNIMISFLIVTTKEGVSQKLTSIYALYLL